MKNDKNPWQVLTSETILSYPIFSVEKSLRKNSASGVEFEFLLIRGLNWVNVIGLTDDNQVILVKQYRHGAEQFTLELPGGCAEKDEEPEKAAIREFAEETGYAPGEIKFIGVVHANPAMYSMKNYFFVATGCHPATAQSLDEGEDVEVVLKPYHELINEVKEGKFAHGLCTAALGLFELKKSELLKG